LRHTTAIAAEPAQATQLVVRGGAGLPLPAALPRPYQPHLMPLHPAATLPSRRHRCARAIPPLVATVIGLLVTGCEVRDEAVAEPRAASHGAGLARLLDRVHSGRQPAVAGPAEPLGGATVEFVEGFAAGVRRARTEGRPMILVFKAGWCRHSGMLLQRTLLDPRVVELSRRYVCVAIDADREPDICRRYAVTAFPTLIVVDADGHAGRHTVGRPSAAELVAVLQSGDGAERTERVATGTGTEVR
jgi:hypothetical protein